MNIVYVFLEYRKWRTLIWPQARQNYKQQVNPYLYKWCQVVNSRPVRQTLLRQVCFSSNSIQALQQINQCVKGGGLIYLRALLNCNFHMGGQGRFIYFCFQWACVRNHTVRVLREALRGEVYYSLESLLEALNQGCVIWSQSMCAIWLWCMRHEV